MHTSLLGSPEVRAYVPFEELQDFPVGPSYVTPETTGGLKKVTYHIYSIPGLRKLPFKTFSALPALTLIAFVILTFHLCRLRDSKNADAQALVRRSLAESKEEGKDLSKLVESCAHLGHALRNSSEAGGSGTSYAQAAAAPDRPPEDEASKRQSQRKKRKRGLKTFEEAGEALEQRAKRAKPDGSTEFPGPHLKTSFICQI